MKIPNRNAITITTVFVTSTSKPSPVKCKYMLFSHSVHVVRQIAEVNNNPENDVEKQEDEVERELIEIAEEKEKPMKREKKRERENRVKLL